MPFSRLRFLFIVILLATNIALGLLGYRQLQRLGDNYTNLVGQSVPILNQLHTVTLDVLRSYRATSQVGLATTRDERLACLARAEALEERSAVERQRFQAATDLINGTQIDAEIEAVARDYHEKLAVYGRLVRDDKAAEAAAYRLGELRESSDRYFDVIDARFAELSRRVGQMTDTYQNSQQGWQRVLLAIGTWPLIVAGLLLVTMAGLVVVLFASVFIPGFGRKKEA